MERLITTGVKDVSKRQQIVTNVQIKHVSLLDIVWLEKVKTFFQMCYLGRA